MTRATAVNQGGIVLVNPRASYEYEFAVKCFPPMGLLYLGSALEAANIPVTVIDANALGLTDVDVVARITAMFPRMVGIPVYAETLYQTTKTIRAIRAALPKVQIVAGGPQASAMPRWLLDSIKDLDAVLSGDAEETLVDWFLNLDTPTRPQIPGLTTRNQPGEAQRPKRPKNLDRLPFPARHLVAEAYDKNRYFTILVPHRDIDCIVTSRGCPWRCRFCYNPDTAIRFRSADSCLSELETLRSRGVRTVEILDDNFTAHRGRAIEILEGIRRAKFSMSFRIKSRADSVDKELMQIARDAGVYQVSVGAESGDPEILERMGKGETVETIENACRLIRDANMHSHTSWIVGYPGETKASIDRTVTLINRCRPTTAGVDILVPYPGTTVYQEAEQAGTLVGEWSVENRDMPWVRLSWTRTFDDLVTARKSMLRRIYWRPRYLWSFMYQTFSGANLTLARHAAREVVHSMPRWLHRGE